MDQKMSRRNLIAAAGAAVPLVTLGKNMELQEPPGPLPADMVRQFVIAAHSKFDVVKSMLEEHPTLLNATLDWKNGDFESAIGGAGHMGRADIARFLIEKGARYDIFVAAMLGELDLVKSHIAAHPNLAKSLGPHGIPLIAHAKAGGDAAAHVLKYLEGLQ